MERDWSLWTGSQLLGPVSCGSVSEVRARDVVLSGCLQTKQILESKSGWTPTWAGQGMEMMGFVCLKHLLQGMETMKSVWISTLAYEVSDAAGRWAEAFCFPQASQKILGNRF